ncbi:hypothetical protein ACFCX0_41495 [Streptomyces sp. NPDC056352]|uniref:hypothetical protein n=1 Tax=Streptomyces sp. NPDC056352 TaxID=3345791 RepID=UPI0035E37F7D
MTSGSGWSSANGRPEPALAAALTLVERHGCRLPYLQCRVRLAGYDTLHRQMIDAIRYVVDSGIKWRNMLAVAAPGE